MQALIESVGANRHNADMDLIINTGTVITGLATVVVGLFSLASIFFDDLV